MTKLKVLLFIPIFSWVFFTSNALQAQSIGVNIGPNYSMRILGQHELSATQLDSFRKLDGSSLNWNFGLDLRLSLNKEWSIVTGVNVVNKGFKRTREGLQFLDSIHIEVGRIEDLSDNGTKIATYTFRYTYLEIPVYFHYDISPKYKRQIYQHSFLFGPSFQYLLDESLDIFLSGFSVGGEFNHKVENTGYSPSNFNIGFALGTRSQIRVEQNLFVSFQPTLNFQVLNTGSDDLIKFNLFQAGLAVGINYGF